MFKIFKVLLIIILFLPELSCRKVNNYFRDPETELLVETLHTTVIAGYAANIAMNVMEGWIFSNVTLLRSNPGFPCTTIMVVNTENETGLYSAAGKVNSITIAGLWPDANTAILTLLFTDYHAGTSKLRPSLSFVKAIIRMWFWPVWIFDLIRIRNPCFNST
jgi:hypothetical protein